MTDCMDIMRVKDNGWILQDPCMQLWFIITSIQRYGHLAWDPRNAGRWSWVYEDHGLLARDPHDTGILLQVTVLMVWNGDLEIRFYYWPCAHLASHGVMWSLQRLLEIVTMVWKCNLSQLITAFSLICWCKTAALTAPQGFAFCDNFQACKVMCLQRF